YDSKSSRFCSAALQFRTRSCPLRGAAWNALCTSPKSEGGLMRRLSIPVVLLAAVTLSSAQSLGDRDYSVSVNVELVQLSVSVLDKHGFPVRGLEQQHFAVYEDKVLQDISLFKQEDIPLSVGLVVDTSSSMFEKLRRVNSAAMTFVRESNP